MPSAEAASCRSGACGNPERTWDRVVVFSALDFGTQTEFERIRYLERLKVRLKKKFEQLDILITVQELVAI
jgi:hypothetical protein